MAYLGRPQKSRGVTLRSELLQVCEGNHCEAMILEVFDRWAVHKLRGQEQVDIENAIREPMGKIPILNTGIWIYMSAQQMAEVELMGLFSQHTVAPALARLVERGLLLRQRNPMYPLDRKYHYALNVKHPALMALGPDCPKLDNGLSKIGQYTQYSNTHRDSLEEERSSLNTPQAPQGVPANGSKDNNTRLLPNAVHTPNSSRARPRTKTQIPPDFMLDAGMQKYADEHGMKWPAGSMAVEFEKFKTHHQAKGSVFKDWRKAWQTWCLNFHPARAQQQQQPDRPRPPTLDEALGRNRRSTVNGTFEFPSKEKP